MIFKVLIFAFLVASTSTESVAAGNGIGTLGEPDKQAHLMIGFQAALVGSRSMEKLFALPRPAAVLITAAGVSAAIVAKELLIDPQVDMQDIYVGAIGMLLGTGLAAFWPKNGLELEAEGGLVGIAPVSGTNPARPPASPLLKAQTTLWFQDAWPGIHLASGGFSSNGDADSKRLILMAGLRAALLNRQHHTLLPWVGLDYGTLLFSAVDTQRDYPAHAQLPFLSLGLRWRQKSSGFQISAESAFGNYSGTALIAAGLSAGLAL